MSSTLLGAIERSAQELAKDYSNIKLVARGAPTFWDANLRGTVRFCVRQGNFLPVLAPRNTAELAADAESPENRITLTQMPDAFLLDGAVLSLGPGRQLATVADVDTSTNIVTLGQDLQGSHTAGETVELYGVEIESIGAQPSGDTVIQVRSRYRVTAGDEIALATVPSLLGSYVSTRVTQAAFLGTALDGRFNYELTLIQPIQRSLANEESLLLRAHPSYESRVARFNMPGPFCLDYLSGPFFDRTVLDEYLSIQLRNAIGDTLPGYTSFVNVAKNFPITQVPIKADALLFWRAIAGQQQWIDGQFVAMTDANRHFCITQELVPEFPAGTEWSIPVLADDSGTIRVKFAPNDYRTYYFVPGIVQRITVGTESTDSDASRIEIAITTSRANARVQLGDWLTTQVSAQQLAYQITSTAYGDNVWQASSLQLKPYFYSLEYIRAQYDLTAYNQGSIHL
jgi:hypothetical protein